MSIDPFMVQALLAGCGSAVALGPLGCLVIWRRMAFVGDALSHASLLGFAISLCWQLPLWPSVFAVAALIGGFLGLQLTQQGRLKDEAWLGVLSYGSLAIALVLLSCFSVPLLDFNSYLFGDLLAVDRADIATMWAVGMVVMSFIGLAWRPLIAATVAPDLASLEMSYYKIVQLSFMVLLAIAIALALKVVGGLMVGALLLLPSIAINGVFNSARAMVVCSSFVGCIFVLLGGVASLVYNIPTGPAIVIAGLTAVIVARGIQILK